MEIVKAKWFNDADSPVVLMIDDLNNLWFDLNENGRPELGEDWGYWRDLPNSSFTFLQENLLNKFPNIKVTFFTVVGEPVICEYKYGKVHQGKMDQNSEMAQFFRSIHRSPNFEIAYHGLTHGVIKDEKYVHEWYSFSSVKEALRNIEEGQKICQQVFGERLRGGKYPGYASNIYSDKSIDKAGFLWWCRDWTYGEYLARRNDYSTLEMKTFGENAVVDFPSTVNPSILSGNPVIRMAKLVFREFFWQFLKAYLERLLRNKEVISIQEHMGAIKANGIRQSPNIIDDMPVLRHIFSFLSERKVWYATCSQITNYFVASTATKVEAVEEGGFRLKYEGKVENPWLTLLIDAREDVEVISDSGKNYPSVAHHYKKNWRLTNIKVEDGYYQVRPREESRTLK